MRPQTIGGAIIAALFVSAAWAGAQKNPGALALFKWYSVNQTASISVPAPAGLAFDGKNMWVASQKDGQVVKVRASDGQVLGAYSTGRSPQGVAFDGANIWVANTGADTVTKLQASDGRVLGTFSVSTPYCIAFDGTDIWVTSFGVNPWSETHRNGDSYRSLRFPRRT